MRADEDDGVDDGVDAADAAQYGTPAGSGAVREHFFAAGAFAYKARREIMSPNILVCLQFMIKLSNLGLH